MRIGKYKRTVVVELIESPVPERRGPEPSEPAPPPQEPAGTPAPTVT